MLGLSGFTTYEFPIEKIVESEIEYHPEWYKVRCLVSVNDLDLIAEVRTEQSNRMINFPYKNFLS